MRRVVVQCRKDEEIPTIMSILEKYGGTLIRPDNPERFVMIHFDLPEETGDEPAKFKEELEDNIPYIAVKIF